jgi:transposase
VSDAPVNHKGGLPAMDKRQALRRIFWILDNGAKRKDLQREFGPRSRCTSTSRCGGFQNFRRLRIRHENSTSCFQSFIHLECSIMLPKQSYGSPFVI